MPEYAHLSHVDRRLKLTAMALMVAVTGLAVLGLTFWMPRHLAAQTDDMGGVRTGDQVLAETSFDCTPTNVYVRSERLHVRCSAAAPGGISYFALATTDPNKAARTLSLLTTALVAGRTLKIYYDPADLSGSAIGCWNSDCRLITGVILY